MAKAVRLSEMKPIVISPLARRVTIAGRSLMLCRYEVKKGCAFEPHVHNEEQMGFVISGQIEFIVGPLRQPIIFEGGSFFRFDSGEPHGSRVLEDAVVIDVFSPVRKDYLAEAVNMVTTDPATSKGPR